MTDNNEHIRLRSCPFCAGDAYLFHSINKSSSTYFTMVKCRNCNAQGKTFGSATDTHINAPNNTACMNAIKSWNTRNIDIDFLRKQYVSLMKELKEKEVDF